MAERRGALGAANRAMAQRLGELLPEREARVRHEAIDALAARVVSVAGPHPPAPPQLLPLLMMAADAAFGALSQLQMDRARLTVRYQAAATYNARKQLLADALREQGRTGRALKADLKARARWLDLEAVQERFTAHTAHQVDQVEVAYRAGRALAQQLQDPRERMAAFAGGRVLQTAFLHAEEGRHESVRSDALSLVTALLRGLPAAERLRTLGAERYARVCGFARGDHASRWLQVAALELATVAAPARAPVILLGVLHDRHAPERMIARRNALRLVAERELPEGMALELARAAVDDPSEHVRQQLAWTLAELPGDRATSGLVRLCRADPSPRVRGVAARALVTRVLAAPELASVAEPAIEFLLREAADPLDIAVALECVARLCCGAQAPSDKARFVGDLAALADRPSTPPALVERGAALLRRLEVESAPMLRELAERFARELATLPEGRSRRLRLPEGLRQRDIEIALATAARGDLTVSLRPLGRNRYRLQRGERRALRLWRLWYELLTPAPDKRKGFAHSHGRVTAAGTVIPSHLLAEVTPTRVPGERRFSAAAGGWGPFLPRVDDLLQAARPWSPPVRIVTSLGVTTVRAARSPLGRAWAWLKTTLGYARLDRLRERALDGQTREQREGYARECAKLGFSFSLGESSGRVDEHTFDLPLSRLTQSLGAFLFVDLRPYLEGPVQYMLSPTGNTPWQLAMLVWFVLSGFLARSAYIMSRIERARRAIPLTLGGWGTRGKSGTERLKAALFHALRYDVVVKTTGCEAMFIHARRDLPAREIFLYRPYDKATIWEQRRVLEFAERLGAHVFLWECMALNPRFVEVLNRDWMQDQVTTLTNAYPDHEDVMGPSGEDVARVIGLFMPRRGTTFTTEDQMLPILREMARRQGTRLVDVGPLEAELLPADLLSRFPYEEHPRNIALVLALAEHYGIDREFALVEMAEHVVPDLGVLKTYPEARYRGRRLSFSNGMSANERAGFLSNWTRLGFDRMDPDEQPDTVSVAVVNNRADRVPRSRVFADIIAADIRVQTVVLIGTNLSGMQRFIDEAWQRQLHELVFDDDHAPEQISQVYDDWLRRVGVPVRPETLRAQLQAMLRAAAGDAQVQQWLERDDIARALAERDDALASLVGTALGELPDIDPALVEDVIEHTRRLLARLRTAERGRRELRACAERGDLQAAAEAARDALSDLNRSRVFVLQDAAAKGDRVVDFVTHQVPPGHLARLMGCQNIKGTGLDFVYRWLSLEAVSDVLQRLRREPSSRGEQLSWLVTYSDYGILDCQWARETLEALVEQGDEQWDKHRALLDSALEHLQALENEKRRALSVTKGKGLVETFLDRAVEPLIDHWDSTRRSARAERVMSDLFEQRVGQGQAALLLRDLVGRQKGGWLSKEFRRLVSRKAQR